MLLPFRYTKLYRRDDVSEEADPRKMEIEDYYEKVTATMDLSQVIDICEGNADPKKITTITFIAGNHVVAFISYRELDKVIADARLRRQRELLLNACQ